MPLPADVWLALAAFVGAVMQVSRRNLVECFRAEVNTSALSFLRNGVTKTVGDGVEEGAEGKGQFFALDIVKLDPGFRVAGGYKGAESNKVCGIGCHFDRDDSLLSELDDL